MKRRILSHMVLELRLGVERLGRRRGDDWRRRGRRRASPESDEHRAGDKGAKTFGHQRGLLISAGVRVHVASAAKAVLVHSRLRRHSLARRAAPVCHGGAHQVDGVTGLTVKIKVSCKAGVVDHQAPSRVISHNVGGGIESQIIADPAPGRCARPQGGNMASAHNPKLRFGMSLHEAQHSSFEPGLANGPPLPAVNYGLVGKQAPSLLRTPSGQPPKALAVVMTWADAEWAALEHVFCAGGAAMPYSNRSQGAWAGWEKYSAGLPSD
jgi:hypothetical protein